MTNKQSGRQYRCLLCIADEHCYGDSNNAECECDCNLL